MSNEKRVRLRATSHSVHEQEVAADDPGALERFVEDVAEGIVPGEVVGVGTVAVLPIKEEVEDEDLESDG